jgi:hypothetical protein
MATIESTHRWPDVTSDAQLAVYTNVVHQAIDRGIPFAIGGSLAMAVYAGLLRPSKDLDIYVTPENKDRMIQVMTDVGLRDFYDTLPYDRGWIYRSTGEDAIVDIIWQMANRRATVDENWLTRGPEIKVEHQRVRLIPIEEMIWSKLYVLQRERSDWPDILNLIDRRTREIDWRYLVSRVGEDAPLLGAALNTYAWLSPQNALNLPGWIWAAVRPNSRPVAEGTRSALLDTRPWLISTIKGEPADVDRSNESSSGRHR